MEREVPSHQDFNWILPAEKSQKSLIPISHYQGGYFQHSLCSICFHASEGREITAKA